VRAHTSPRPERPGAGNDRAAGSGRVLTLGAATAEAVDTVPHPVSTLVDLLGVLPAGLVVGEVGSLVDALVDLLAVLVDDLTDLVLVLLGCAGHLVHEPHEVMPSCVPVPRFLGLTAPR